MRSRMIPTGREGVKMKTVDKTSSDNRQTYPDSNISRLKNPVILFLVAIWVAAISLLVVVLVVGLIFNMDLSGTIGAATWGFMNLVLLSLVIYIAWRVKVWIEGLTRERSPSTPELSALKDDISEIRRMIGETSEKVDRIEKILKEVTE